MQNQIHKALNTGLWTVLLKNTTNLWFTLTDSENNLIGLFATTISKIFLFTVVQPSRTGYFVSLEMLIRLNSSPCSISDL